MVAETLSFMLRSFVPRFGGEFPQKKNATSVSGCFTVKKTKVPTSYDVSNLPSPLPPPEDLPKKRKGLIAKFQPVPIYLAHCAKPTAKIVYIYIYIGAPPTKNLCFVQEQWYLPCFTHILASGFWELLFGGAAYINKIYKINDM